MVVTILVFLAALLQPSTICTWNTRSLSVTILVFLAALLQQKRVINWAPLSILQLQSLFFWQLYCNKNVWWMAHNPYFVTILVFLAALLQRKHDSWIGIRNNSYNPCFSGSSIATKTIQKRITPRILPVTILVFLAALLQLKHQGEQKWIVYPEVTILVFLAALLQPGVPHMCLIRQVRYNPCFSGSSIATCGIWARYQLHLYVTILVFLAALLQLQNF